MKSKIVIINQNAGKLRLLKQEEAWRKVHDEDQHILSLSNMKSKMGEKVKEIELDLEKMRDESDRINDELI